MQRDFRPVAEASLARIGSMHSGRVFSVMAAGKTADHDLQILHSRPRVAS